MKAGEVYAKTMQFCWLKLLVGIVHIVVAGLLFAILMGVAVLFGSDGVSAIVFIVWLSLLGIIKFIFKHYLGYLLKAGHVAVIALVFLYPELPHHAVSLSTLSGLLRNKGRSRSCLYGITDGLPLTV